MAHQMRRIKARLLRAVQRFASHIQTAHRSPGPGRVRIQGNNKAPGKALQQPQLRFCQRRAHLRHQVAEPQLPALHHIHVPFHNHRLARLTDVSPGHVQAKQKLALIKQRRLRRVQVLGHPIFVQRARAKTYHLAIHIPDRDHQPVAEAVIARVTLRVLR